MQNSWCMGWSIPGSGVDTQMFIALLGDVYLSSREDVFQVGNFLFQSCLLYFGLKRVCVCLWPQCVWGPYWKLWLLTGESLSEQDLPSFITDFSLKVPGGMVSVTQACKGCMFVQLTASLVSVHSFGAHHFFQLHLKDAGGVTKLHKFLQVLWKWLAEQRRHASAVIPFRYKVFLPATRSFTQWKGYGERWDQGRGLIIVS